MRQARALHSETASKLRKKNWLAGCTSNVTVQFLIDHLILRIPASFSLLTFYSLCFQLSSVSPHPFNLLWFSLPSCFALQC